MLRTNLSSLQEQRVLSTAEASPAPVPYSLRRGYSSDLELTNRARLADQNAPGSYCLSNPRLYVGAAEPHSGPHGRVAGTLPNEFFQPLSLVFLFLLTPPSWLLLSYCAVLAKL